MRRKQVQIGNVVIPQDLDREAYVQYALRTNTVCVVTNDGDFMKNCPISSSFCGYNDGWYSSMEFPPNEYTLGTQVVLLNMSPHDIPIVIGTVLPKKGVTKLVEEYELNISRVYEEVNDTDDVVESSMFEISGKGLSGVLSLIADSSLESGGKVHVSAFNDHGKGEIVLKTNYLSLRGGKSVSISSNEILTLLVSDAEKGEEQSKVILEMLLLKLESSEIVLSSIEKTSIDSKEIVITSTEKASLDSKVIEIGSENMESALLGDSTVVQLDKDKAMLVAVVSAIKNTPSVPQDGGTAVFTAIKAAVAVLKDADYSKVKSKKLSIE